MKINCNISPEFIKYIDELILLCTERHNLFFNDPKTENYEINLVVKVNNEKVICEGEFRQNHYFYCEEKSELKLMLKRSIFQVLSKILGRPLSPWGILTGVRPTKVIQGFIDDGLTVEEIKIELKNNYLVSPEKIEIMFKIRDEQKNLLGKLQNSLNIYIGIPFCPSRCSYCSFTSYTTNKSKDLIEPYLQGLLEEINFYGDIIKEKGMNVVTIYIGGGTPSILSPKQIQILLERVEKSFPVDKLLEYTFEGGRPDTLTEEKLKIIKRFGVNRLSINPQTMNDQTLEIIGRTHTKEQFIRVFNQAKELGFNWINTDLIIGLADEGFKEFRKTLEDVITLNPENITVHSLALKRAAIQKGKSPLTFNEAKEIMDFTYTIMGESGYTPYYLYRQKAMAGNQENIGFTKTGFISPYNVVSIEEIGNVLALGSGGISKVVRDGEIIRFSNPKDPNQYLEKIKARDFKEVFFR
ncbi:coproporphyrinogen dehydrogenase HemZ [Anaerobranca gottschalkii]|uniref:Oxygen-independent coproporphyrinogen-3 oxidase n=1 Tax=Anaerobranca gottschalkii DSM 13577 TaxID=1120990 RepID=A0A1I0ATE8_9FIRM|nr:coproporphyrinogen dehydrogenase HemZ [Anaerobranca gottschalkii]SES97178.1 oxygen-independent coproporphyrinogen-3 oxidase [Anaerobranca gottschalkii DSM 13577]